MSRRRLVLTAALAVCAVFSGCSPQDLVSIVNAGEQRPADQRFEQAVSERGAQLSGRGFDALSTDEERRVYSAIDYDAQSAGGAWFTISGTDHEKVGSILDLYKGDHPEVFWFNDGGGYEYITHSGFTEIRLRYSLRGEALIEAKKELRRSVDDMIKDIPDEMSGYDRELWINDRLLGSCKYDVEAANDEEVNGNEQNAYGALVEGKAVCEGYTRAFQLLCGELGVECVSVNGTGIHDGKTANHIWNAVCLDGEWYFTDVTWNDIIPDSDRNAVLTDVEKHLYFNITTEKLCGDHAFSPLYGSGEEADYCNAFIPECTSEKYNYFRCSLPTLYPGDDAEVKESVAQAAAEGRKSAAFMIDADAGYTDMTDAVINGLAAEWIDYANSENYGGNQLSRECMLYAYEEVNAAALVLEYES